MITIQESVTFTVFGSLTSNNVATRRVGRTIIPNPKAVRDKSRVFQLAFAAAHEANWRWAAASAMTIVAYNTRKDVGNIEKVIADGCIGAIYLDDRSLIELHVEKRRDRHGERYIVTVEPREALEIPKPLRNPKPTKVISK